MGASVNTSATNSSNEEFFLDVNNLSVRLPTGPRSQVHAVKNVALQVRPGERVGIVGESGSGKSVTGRAIAGLLPGSRRVEATGSIRIEGQEYIGKPSKAWNEVRRSKVSMIFQDPLSYLNPTMRIGRQVKEACRPQGGRNPSDKDVYEFLELAGLTNVDKVAARFPFELSGGMRQRVLIAIALAKRPGLIIADEPTTALDVTVQAKVLESLDQSVSELGTSLIMISHDLAVVAELCDRVYVMLNGRIVESGPTVDVFTNPREPYTEALLKSVRSLTVPGEELISYTAAITASMGEDDQ